MMPSPLNFRPTPVVAHGAGLREDDEGRKRRAEGDAVAVASAVVAGTARAEKRVKT